MISEAKFQRLVRSWLDESFAQIDAEPRLESLRRPDFIAYTPFESYVIEVENGWDSVYDGIGQSLVYASETGHVPVVIFPADNVRTDELERVQEYDYSPTIVTL